MPATVLSYFDRDGSHAVVLDRASTSVGRSASCDVVLSAAEVSRQHAVVLRDGDAFTVLDRNSTHGTFLNGRRVERAALKPGDVLQFGSLHGVKVRFELRQLEPAGGRAQFATLRGLTGSLLDSFEQLRAASSKASGEANEAVRELGQLNWLLSAARQLNEGGAQAMEILSVLLDLTLQLTGFERAIAFLCEEGAMRFAAGLGADGASVEEDATVSRNAMQRAIDSELKFSIGDTLTDRRASGWDSILANNIRSICCIPLRRRLAAGQNGQLLGLLYLDSQIRPGTMSEIDHRLLDTIATEAAALVENALLAEAERKARQARDELAVAARIHSGLMSLDLPQLPYAQLDARSLPCLAIGGDFYDAVPLEGSMCVAMVDVSGKGVPAAIVAATLQGVIHAQFLAGHGLAEIAAMVNRFLCARNVGKYATMVLLRLFPDGRVEYLNCGHIPPLAIAEGEVRTLDRGNTIVGLLAGASYTPAQDRLRPGERLYLATDGVTEAENPAGEMFGHQGLSEAARQGGLDAILAKVASHQAPSPAQDDCTLMEIRYTGG